MIEISLLLLCLLSQNVTVVSVMTLNLTSTGECESLLCTGVCLQLWHFYFVLKFYYNKRWQRIYQDGTTQFLLSSAEKRFQLSD